jgi:hypothetical protein
MNHKEPEALRLADAIDMHCRTCKAAGFYDGSVEQQEAAATELRRLYALKEQLLNALKTAEALLYAHRKPIDPAITAALDNAKE